jgi:hypothetical protein
LNLPGISKQSIKAKYRNPDLIVNVCDEFEKITGGTYQHVMGSRSIAPYMSLDTNTSKSFNVLISGIRKLTSGGNTDVI